jgi:hypothetical protein
VVEWLESHHNYNHLCFEKESKTFGLGRGLLMVYGGVGPAPEPCFCFSNYHTDIVVNRFMIVFDILVCDITFVCLFLMYLF